MVAQVIDRRDAPALVVIDGGRMRLNLHRGQQRAWRSTKRFVCVIAGSQSGKTAFGPHWLRREISLKGPGDYMVVTPTFPLLEIKALPEFRRLFEHQLQLGTYHASPPRRFEVSPDGEIRLFGKRQEVPTTIWFGYAADPDSLESATAKGLWLDECGQTKFKLGSWEALQRRIALNQGRALLTTTPYNLGWLYQEIWLPWVESGRNHPDIDVINFDSTMNPAFSRAEFDRLRRTMPGWKFDLFHRGIFTRPAGLIYNCFSRDDHTLPRFAIPGSWPRFLGMDFGGVNTAGIFFAQERGENGTPTGRYIGYREYLAGDRTANEHVSSLLKGEPRRPLAYGGARSEGQWRAEFGAGGLAIKLPVVADVEVGITRVWGGINSGKFILFDDLKGTLDQLGTYSRVLDERGDPTEEIEDKASYHFLDAWRYIGSYLIGGRAPGVAAAGVDQQSRWR
jgi:hypothetical protein